MSYTFCNASGKPIPLGSRFLAIPTISPEAPRYTGWDVIGAPVPMILNQYLELEEEDPPQSAPFLAALREVLVPMGPSRSAPSSWEEYLVQVKTPRLYVDTHMLDSDRPQVYGHPNDVLRCFSGYGNPYLKEMGSPEVLFTRHIKHCDAVLRGRLDAAGWVATLLEGGMLLARKAPTYIFPEVKRRMVSASFVCLDVYEALAPASDSYTERAASLKEVGADGGGLDGGFMLYMASVLPDTVEAYEPLARLNVFLERLRRRSPHVVLNPYTFHRDLLDIDP